jgi:peptidoglycan/LPS O-acetylase OafA/YrhL
VYGRLRRYCQVVRTSNGNYCGGMPSRTNFAPARTTARNSAAIAALADAALILLFAGIGRDAHQRGEVVTGVFQTAWPFLAGAAIAWFGLRIWRAPLRVWPAGVAVWLGTVALGMVLRAMTGHTVVLPFVIVALLSLGVFLVGYRLIVAGIQRLTRRRQRG